ncbi:hypothetical protein [Clostridium thermobutyricum]|uniref:hypothetical protein n=1 Tax=Clostridium thermobutyricum TaxID=29372 RepID=UPI0018ABDF04|nr:hypothetical protein [Clostridium thermobutyricum]
MKYKLSTEKEGILEEKIIEADSYGEAYDIYKQWMIRMYEGGLTKDELKTWGNIETF